MVEITECKPLEIPKQKLTVPEQVPLKPITLDPDLLKQAEVPYQELDAYEKARMLVQLVPFIFLYLKGKLMKDWKTTLSGAIGGIAILLRVFGVDIPQPVLDGVAAVALFCIGLLSRDAVASTEGK